MTNRHPNPITPPPELVEQWRKEPEYTDGNKLLTMVTMTTDRLMQLCEKSAQHGADIELEACCEWTQGYAECGDSLRVARRPKSQTLNSIALEMLGTIERMDVVIPEITDTIRRALEQLDED
jgi:hypothetical protein